MTRRPDLTALVSSRICHDLISPLGAIGNGVELLGLTGQPASPELSLIEESVQSANAKIRFFRVAYGEAGPDQKMSRAEITATLAAVGRGGRISYQWDAPEEQLRSDVRIIFLLLQCLELAMPMGGAIRVAREGPRWEVIAEADRFIVDEPLWDSLSNPRARVAITAARVHFALLGGILAECDRRLSVNISDESIMVRF